MKRTAIALFLTAIANDASSQTRPSTVNRPCVASRQLVLSMGAVVLGTGGYTYDRFVRDSSFCEVGEYPDPAFVPSLDAPRCFVGYRCKTGPYDLFGGD